MAGWLFPWLCWGCCRQVPGVRWSQASIGIYVLSCSRFLPFELCWEGSVRDRIVRLGFSGWRSSVVEHSLGKGEVESSILSVSSISFKIQVAVVRSPGGSNSVVESQPSKLLVAGPIPVSRSTIFKALVPK